MFTNVGNYGFGYLADFFFFFFFAGFKVDIKRVENKLGSFGYNL